jgi:hypothetical protein
VTQFSDTAWGFVWFTPWLFVLFFSDFIAKEFQNQIESQFQVLVLVDPSTGTI